MKKYFKILFTFVLMFGFSSLAKAESLGCEFSLFNVYDRLSDSYNLWYLSDDTQSRDVGSPTYANVGTAYRKKVGNTCLSGYDMNSQYVSNQFLGYVIGFYDSSNNLGNRFFLPKGQEQQLTIYLSTRAYNLYKDYGIRLEAYSSSTTSSTFNVKNFDYATYCKSENSSIGGVSFTYKCNLTYTYSQDAYLTFYLRAPQAMTNYLALDIGYSFNNIYENINDSINNATDKILQGQDKINDTLNSEDFDTSSKKCGVVCKLKGIWEGIVSLPKKVADAFGDILKSLFVPENDYFKNWFDELSTYFNNKLGFLVYPFTFITDTLNRYLNLEDTGHYVISIPDIKAPLFDTVIFSATSYDLADLLKNSTFSYAHNLWFAFLNFGVLVAFLNLCYRKYVSIFGGDNSGDYEYFTEEEGHEYDINSGEVTRSWIKSKKSSRKKVE